MAKTINFSYDGIDYELEYTRKTISVMEKQGFNFNELTDKPMTTLPRLFAGAFLAHHKYLKAEQIDKLYDLIAQKEDLLIKLHEMYKEAMDTLFDDPGDEKNVKWEANW